MGHLKRIMQAELEAETMDRAFLEQVAEEGAALDKVAEGAIDQKVIV